MNEKTLGQKAFVQQYVLSRAKAGQNIDKSVVERAIFIWQQINQMCK